MADIEITTVAGLISAIKAARTVCVQPRFGISDRWVKVSKVEAMSLAKALTYTDTPKDLEMYGGSFGTLVGRTLYLG